MLTGYTPFACEDRHNTKLRILKHHETLHFPDPDDQPQPVSAEALNIIKRMLVEKEYRLCTRRYELNDYTKKYYNVSGSIWHDETLLTPVLELSQARTCR